jgi:hypothetical protein
MNSGGSVIYRKYFGYGLKKFDQLAMNNNLLDDLVFLPPVIDQQEAERELELWTNLEFSTLPTTDSPSLQNDLNALQQKHFSAAPSQFDSMALQSSAFDKAVEFLNSFDEYKPIISGDSLVTDSKLQAKLLSSDKEVISTPILTYN